MLKEKKAQPISKPPLMEIKMVQKLYPMKSSFGSVFLEIEHSMPKLNLPTISRYNMTME